jgi:hypothetical protein
MEPPNVVIGSNDYVVIGSNDWIIGSNGVLVVMNSSNA